jgi:signal transduction histidine kinase
MVFKSSSLLRQPTEPKRFRLLRNFSLISLSGFVLTTSLLSVIYRQQSINNLVDSTERNNVALAQILSNTIWTQYGAFFASSQTLTREELVSAPEIQQLEDTVIQQMEGLSVSKIKVFDTTGRTIFSTDSRQIGRQKKPSDHLQNALAGQVSSHIGHHDKANTLRSRFPVDQKLLISHIPIRAEGSDGEIVGAFELYADVAPAIAQIESAQRLSLLTSWLLLGGLYGILVIFVRNADRLLSKQYNQVQQSESLYRQQSEALATALSDLKRSQAQVLHSEKMSSLGQMVAGVAHELNNPVNFIHGNLKHIERFIQDVMEHLALYETHYPEPDDEIQDHAEDIDLAFVRDDLSQTLDSMKTGTSRIRDIVLSLRTFSRLDEADCKAVDIHQGLDSTLMILQHRFNAEGDRPAIEVVRNYAELPLVECYAGSLNQVFMNLLINAIDALKEQAATNQPRITLRTEHQGDTVIIRVADNGKGMSAAVRSQIFDPFFTTKDVGKGTGMGLAITHQLVTEKHKGSIRCISTEGIGTEFIIEIPINQTAPVKPSAPIKLAV